MSAPSGWLCSWVKRRDCSPRLKWALLWALTGQPPLHMCSWGARGLEASRTLALSPAAVCPLGGDPRQKGPGPRLSLM